jgi:hypothetical protein
VDGRVTTGTRTLAGLNNQGEVLYLYSTTNATDGTAIPALWLPKPNYGLPAGFTRLTNFQALARSALPWFGDDGTFYTLVTNAEQQTTIYRGTAAGESLLCSQVSYQPLPEIFRPGIGGGDHYSGRRMFFVDGVTAVGQPFGHVNVQRTINSSTAWMLSLFSEDMPLNGLFVGSPPVARVTAVPTQCGPGGIPNTVASSPNGTMLVFSDYCCPDWQNARSPYASLSVVRPDSVRIISDNPYHTGLEYPAPDSSMHLAVNDAGDAAGLNGDVRSLWFSARTGGVIRAGRTNMSSVLVDSGGSVWFVSDFYQDIWHGNQNRLICR